jgi:hypothetical protein
MPADIPTLPDMRPLELSDRALLYGLFADLRPQQSEFTFTNLFVWRDAYQLRLSRTGDALAVFSWRADPEDSFLFPLLGGGNAQSLRTCLEHMEAKDHNARMARATESDLARLGIGEAEFTVEQDRDQWDYVYPVEELVALAGNRHHRKRNHIDQFARAHNFRYLPLTPALAEQCRQLQDRWCDDKHCDLVSTLRAEARAIKDVLDRFEELEVTGGCIEIDGEVEAFTLAELLNPETVVVHIEKANAAFHGLYQVINQKFLEQQWSTVTYVNREQDLGIPGLRKAKDSYHPHHMVEKFVVRLK